MILVLLFFLQVASAHTSSFDWSAGAHVWTMQGPPEGPWRARHMLLETTEGGFVGMTFMDELDDITDYAFHWRAPVFGFRVPGNDTLRFVEDWSAKGLGKNNYEAHFEGEQLVGLAQTTDPGYPDQNWHPFVFMQSQPILQPYLSKIWQQEQTWVAQWWSPGVQWWSQEIGDFANDRHAHLDAPDLRLHSGETSTQQVKDMGKHLMRRVQPHQPRM